MNQEMMIVPGGMQVTLVAFYGKKDEQLASFILACQEKIQSIIGPSFLPYRLEQVHATIVGLEGTRTGNAVQNANFEKHRGELRLMDPSALLEFVRSSEFQPIDVKIGGYMPSGAGFDSRGQEPYARSFSANGDIAVVMGWPATAPRGDSALDDCRRAFNRLNVLHSWHQNESDIDDDFYFVLGRTQHLGDEKREKLIQTMRNFLSTEAALEVTIDQHCLSVVGYLDTLLTPGTSCAFRVLKREFTPKALLELYPDA